MSHFLPAFAVILAATNAEPEYDPSHVEIDASPFAGFVPQLRAGVNVTALRPLEISLAFFSGGAGIGLGTEGYGGWRGIDASIGMATPMYFFGSRLDLGIGAGRLSGHWLALVGYRLVSFDDYEPPNGLPTPYPPLYYSHIGNGIAANVGFELTWWAIPRFGVGARLALGAAFFPTEGGNPYLNGSGFSIGSSLIVPDLHASVLIAF